MPTAGVPALPLRRLPFTVADGELVPALLGDRDRPWLRDLLEQAHGFVGRPLAEWLEYCRRSDTDPRAGVRQAPTVHVLTALMRRAATGPDRSALRQRLYRMRASGLTQAAAWASIAVERQLAVDELQSSLFADLPDRRLMRWPEPELEPSQLALATNSSMVQGLLRHAFSSELQLLGASRALLRTAWLHGARFDINSREDGSVVCRWQRDDSARSSRAITSLLPLLPWARRYRLSADCRIGRDRGRVVLTTGDPLLPGDEPRRYDSQLEQAFARELVQARPTWGLLREPAPIVLGDEAGGGLAFPDFAITAHADRPPWLCEIAGLRDRRALPAKLALLQHPRMVVCIPSRSVPDEWRDHPRLVSFQRHIDVDRVVAIVEDAKRRCAPPTRS